MVGGKPGQIVILNGPPRSGKSSIVRALQSNSADIWLNLGVDIHQEIIPERCRPGIGLRPGGERPEIEALVPAFYAALYESIASHSRLGFNVVADLGHHDAYSRPLHILPDCARRLADLPALFVGIHCPLDVIMERRRRTEPDRKGLYVTASTDEEVPAPVLAWQRGVHSPGIYDLELDTSVLTAEECARAIEQRLRNKACVPSALKQLSETSPDRV